MLDPFSGSATTGIAANLLGRRYLGLEIEEEFLLMSKARREEIDNFSIKSEYIAKLVKSQNILPPEPQSVVEEDGFYYNVPWLYEE